MQNRIISTIGFKLYPIFIYFPKQTDTKRRWNSGKCWRSKKCRDI